MIKLNNLNQSILEGKVQSSMVCGNPIRNEFFSLQEAGSSTAVREDIDDGSSCSHASPGGFCQSRCLKLGKNPEMGEG